MAPHTTSSVGVVVESVADWTEGLRAPTGSALHRGTGAIRGARASGRVAQAGAASALGRESLRSWSREPSHRTASAPDS